MKGAFFVSFILKRKNKLSKSIFNIIIFVINEVKDFQKTPHQSHKEHICIIKDFYLSSSVLSAFKKAIHLVLKFMMTVSKFLKSLKTWHNIIGWGMLNKEILSDVYKVQKPASKLSSILLKCLYILIYKYMLPLFFPKNYTNIEN